MSGTSQDEYLTAVEQEQADRVGWGRFCYAPVSVPEEPDLIRIAIVAMDTNGYFPLSPAYLPWGGVDTISAMVDGLNRERLHLTRRREQHIVQAALRLGHRQARAQARRKDRQAKLAALAASLSVLVLVLGADAVHAAPRQAAPVYATDQDETRSWSNGVTTYTDIFHADHSVTSCTSYLDSTGTEHGQCSTRR